MKQLNLTLTLLLAFLVVSTSGAVPVSAQETEESPVGITGPLPGEAIQGLVQITGFIQIEEWESFDLEFSFSGQNIWFPVSTGKPPLEDALLGEWDTSLVTDGSYDFRITVILADGSSLSAETIGIRVRNYSVIETQTPAPTEENIQVIPTITPTSTSAPTIEPIYTPPPLNPNSAEFSSFSLRNSLIRGGIFGIIGFAFLLLVFLRKQKN